MSTHHSSGLEDLEDLSVDTLKGGGVAGSLNGVNGVEAVGAELLLEGHKVALDKRNLVGETSASRLLASAADLELVVVDTDNVGVREASNLAGGTTNTTADVENAHAGAEANHGGEVVLVASKGLEEGLALVEATEVERLA